MNIFDTHAHLSSECYKNNIDLLIEECKENGVKKIVNASDSLESMEGVLELAEKHKDIMLSSLGIFPTYSINGLSYLEDGMNFISDNLSIVSAIGEIGLDYHDKPSNKEKDLQKDFFIKQILFSKAWNLPIVVHSRDADFDTYEIIKEYEPILVDLHCFSQSVEMAQLYLNLPFKVYFGVGGVVTFKNAKNILNVVSFLPIERILTETDSPFLTPTPFRGQQNSPINIKYVISKIAEIKKLDVETTAKILFNNALEFYGINDE